MHFRQPEYKVVTSKKNYLCSFGKVKTKICCALKPFLLAYTILIVHTIYNLKKKQAYNSKELVLDF